MTVIILGGGKSRRMGHRDKAFLKIGKTSMIKRQIRLLQKHFKKIIIVTNTRKKYEDLEDVKIVSDLIAHRGPLAGIWSGLLASETDYNFVVACDMPFLNLPLIKYMQRKTSGYDVVVPKINNRYEPLFCIYSKRCARFIKQLLDKKIFKISKLFSKVKVKEIALKELSRFGCLDKIFMNINTPDDYRKING